MNQNDQQINFQKSFHNDLHSKYSSSQYVSKVLFLEKHQNSYPTMKWLCLWGIYWSIFPFQKCPLTFWFWTQVTKWRRASSLISRSSSFARNNYCQNCVLHQKWLVHLTVHRRQVWPLRKIQLRVQEWYIWNAIFFIRTHSSNKILNSPYL